jgi:hypothetical protein
MKIILSIIAMMLFITGCGEKPIVVRAKQKPVYTPTKPIYQTKKSTIYGKKPTITTRKRIDSKYPPGLDPTIIGQEVPTEVNQTVILGERLPNGENQTVIVEGRLPSESNRTIVLGEEVKPEILDASTSDSYVATLKTKQFSFSDAAFMRDEMGVLELQILTAGKPLLNLKIAEDVCVDHNCITKMEFNDKYLNHYYPPNLIDNVLRGEPIFDGRNLKKTTKGFMQKIQDENYYIKYKTTPGNIYFKDVKNGIVIKLRKLHQ